MTLTVIDLIAFLLFLAIVVGVSLYAGRRERSDEDYFLAGRSLTWPLIGVSLIASNISTEHFVGMAGSAFGRVGMAIASYEWMAAVTLVIVAWWLLPIWLRTGIYTMPQFLEFRYNAGARALMAGFIMAAYVIVAMATVLYSGAIGLNAIFGIPEWFGARFGLDEAQATFWATVAGIWLIGLIAGAYTAYGGLKAVVWSDLLQGGALLIGGAVVAVLGFIAIGGDAGFVQGVLTFAEHNADKLHTVLPWDDPEIPWLAVFVGGLWIPNLFYWGLNQFITQRTLGAKSLAEGQKGIIFAAFLKLLIPFIIVLPGIMAYQLYADRISTADAAYPFLIRELLPPSLRGVMLAALFGAVMSSFNSMLNSASTILTVDLFKRHWKKDATQAQVVQFGRWATVAFVIVACLWAPVISQAKGVYHYIQLVWGFITPGIVAAFLVGLLVKRTPPAAAITGMILNIPVYGLLNWLLPEVAFLHHMLITFAVIVATMGLITHFRPLPMPVTLPEAKRIEVIPMKGVRGWGWGVIIITAGLYAFFW